MSSYMIQEITEEDKINNTSSNILYEKLHNFKNKIADIQQEEPSLSSLIKISSLNYYVTFIEKHLQYRENIINYQNKINDLFNTIHNKMYHIFEEKIMNMIQNHIKKDNCKISEDLYIYIMNEYKMIEKIFNIYIFSDNNEQNIISIYINLLYNIDTIDENILDAINFRNLDIFDTKNKEMDIKNKFHTNKNIRIEYNFFSHEFIITIKYPSFDNL